MGKDPFADNVIVLDERERDILQAWVDRAKPLLGLSDHRIVISRHAAERDADATSSHLEHATHMVISLRAGLADWTPDELRHSLTHELLHAYFQPLTRLVEELLEGELGKRTEAIIEAAVTAMEETTIDRLAAAVARLLPAIDLPPPDAS